MYKRMFLVVVVALLAVMLWSLPGRGTNTVYEVAEEMLVFRRIGHEFLLSAGDATSRVMPVKKISEREFRVEFEKPFAFLPDSLVAVTRRVINPLDQPLHYIVNVAKPGSNEVVYSFTWPAEDKDIPCTGRVLPADQYALNIMYTAEKPVSTSKTVPVVAAGLSAICLVFFAWRFSRKKGDGVVSDVHSDYISIGKFRFYALRHLLVFEENEIELTSKEAKLLRIFSTTPNAVIDRNQLLREGWEDEGVITGRSLDMYVSKLRKKLQQDGGVSIINVHGKGYRLNC